MIEVKLKLILLFNNIYKIFEFWKKKHIQSRKLAAGVAPVSPYDIY